MERIQNEIDEEERGFEPLPGGVNFEPDEINLNLPPTPEGSIDLELPDLGDYQDQPEGNEPVRG